MSSNSLSFNHIRNNEDKQTVLVYSNPLLYQNVTNQRSNVRTDAEVV